MSERLVKRLQAQKLSGQTPKSETVRFAGGVCTEDPYGGRLGQGALRDAHNIEIGDKGLRDKRGWVRFWNKSFSLPIDEMLVISATYTLYSPQNTNIVRPAPNTYIANFNGSGQSVFFIGYSYIPDTSNQQFIAYFAVGPDQDIDIFTGSSLGTMNASPYWASISDGPNAIDDAQIKNSTYMTLRGLAQPAFNASTGERGVGIFVYKNKVFCLAALGGFIIIRMCDASNNWTEIPINTIVYFRDGAVKVDDGASINGATSGTTATAYRVVLSDGSWDAGDARGYFCLGSSVAGAGWSVGENIRVGVTVVAKTPASGNIGDQVRIPDGSGIKFRHAKYNYSGITNRYSAYFVTGTYHAIELFMDGSTIVVSPIRTLIGITSIANWNAADSEDKPQFLAAHRSLMFLGYPGGSIQNSGFGDPFDFRAVVGFDEKSTGEDITNMVPEIGGSCLVSTTNSWWALYGDAQQNYDLQLIDSSVGCFPDAVSSLLGLIFLYAGGLTTIKQATDFGNWSINELTRDIQTKITQLINDCTCIRTLAIRDVGILRFVFDQTRSESATGNDSESVWLALKAGPNGIEGYTFGSYNLKVIDITESDMSINANLPVRREVFFLAADGFVYRDETVCIADDAPLMSRIDTAILVVGSNLVNKDWCEAYFDSSSQTGGEMRVTATYHDADGFRRPAPEVSLPITSGACYWDTGRWDESYWDDNGSSNVRMKLYGAGDGVSFSIASSKFLQAPSDHRSVRLTFIPTETRRHR